MIEPPATPSIVTWRRLIKILAMYLIVSAPLGFFLSLVFTSLLRLSIPVTLLSSTYVTSIATGTAYPIAGLIAFRRLFSVTFSDFTIEMVPREQQACRNSTFRCQLESSSDPIKGSS